jgi:predicted ATPase
MTDPVLLTRVVLRNYKSIAACAVRLGPLTYLLGPNGSGKSNFVDALHLVRDALTGSLDHALSERGGLNEVRRRSGGHPTHFGIRLEMRLPDDGRPAIYAFRVGAVKDGDYVVQSEHCAIGSRPGSGPAFRIENGRVEATSEASFPAVTADRLGLVAGSGLTAFRPVYDALTSMGFYNLNPKLMRELQKPQDGRLLKPAGENIASVLRHLGRLPAGSALETIEGYLKAVVPTVHGVEHKQVGPMETLEFRQDMAGSQHPWRFLAQNMSDGTLRALGILTALFQGGDEPSRLVGIEEPETALHPGRLRGAARGAEAGRRAAPSAHHQSQPGSARRCGPAGRCPAGGRLGRGRDAHSPRRRRIAPTARRPALHRRRAAAPEPADPGCGRLVSSDRPSARPLSAGAGSH